jgi:hypothetical protein
MSAIDAGRLAALAARLKLTPRQLLVLAARIAARQDVALDAAHLVDEIARVRAAGETGEDAGTLALLGYGPYALDDIERGLALAWSPALATDP